MALSIAWTLPRTASPDWNVTVVRQRATQVIDPELSDVDLVAACLDSRPGAFDVIV